MTITWKFLLLRCNGYGKLNNHKNIEYAMEIRMIVIRVD